MPGDKQKILISFKKAQSSIERMVKMIQEDHYCIGIMQQNLAVIGLLKSAHQALMKNHLQTCFKKAIEAKNERRKQQMIEEILKVIKLFNR